MSVDPLADMYPAWSGYNYVLDNPTGLIDPDGREVRSTDSATVARAATELNSVHSNETNISVVKTEWQESAAVWYMPWTWGDTRTVSGFKLSTSESSFDWSSDQYTSALFDVINSKEVSFDLGFVPGDQVIFPEFGPAGTAFETGGRTRSYSGGARIVVSADGNSLGEPTGVTIMHELVGHGHPAGGTRANWKYQQITNSYYGKNKTWNVISQRHPLPKNIKADNVKMMKVGVGLTLINGVLIVVDVSAKSEAGWDTGTIIAGAAFDGGLLYVSTVPPYGPFIALGAHGMLIYLELFETPYDCWEVQGCHGQ